MTFPGGGIRLRLFQPADEPRVRGIFAATAAYGRPLTGKDLAPDFLYDVWVRPYQEWEGEFFWVAVAGDELVGYVTGCPDTRRHHRVYARRLFPRLAGEIVRRGLWRQGRFWNLGARFALSGVFSGPARRRVVRRFPAHCHLNIRPGCQRSGAGGALLARFLESLHARGVAGIHVGSATEGGRRFFEKSGFHDRGGYPTFAPAPAPREVRLLVKDLSGGRTVS